MDEEASPPPQHERESVQAARARLPLVDMIPQGRPSGEEDDIEQARGGCCVRLRRLAPEASAFCNQCAATAEQVAPCGQAVVRGWNWVEGPLLLAVSCEGGLATTVSHRDGYRDWAVGIAGNRFCVWLLTYLNAVFLRSRIWALTGLAGSFGLGLLVRAGLGLGLLLL